jgi:hypothetical protein
LTKKFISDKSAKLEMIYKINQRQLAREELERERLEAMEQEGA